MVTVATSTVTVASRLLTPAEASLLPMPLPPTQPTVSKARNSQQESPAADRALFLVPSFQTALASSSRKRRRSKLPRAADIFVMLVTVSVSVAESRVV